MSIYIIVLNSGECDSIEANTILEAIKKSPYPAGAIHSVLKTSETK